VHESRKADAELMQPADIAVLATGNTPARLPFGVPPSERIITDPWLPGTLAPSLAARALPALALAAQVLAAVSPAAQAPGLPTVARSSSWAPASPCST
jgi:hypothetical protein